MIVRLQWMTAVGGCLLAAVAARGDDLPPAIDARALFAQLDANNDGELVGDEVPESKRSLYERLVRLGDGNADGKLSADEFAVGLAGGGTKAAAPAKSGDAKQPPAKSRPGRPGKAARPVPGRFFAQLDANQDGTVTPDEVPEARRENFAKMVARFDKNDDGGLSASELPAAGAAQPASLKRAKPDQSPERMFKRIDVNQDGKITADEVPEQRREVVGRMIRRGDKDGDGALSSDEFEEIAKLRAEAAKKRPDSPAKKPAAKKPAAKPGEAAKTAKKNKQVRAMPASLFRAVDTDRNGTLSGEEISAAPASIKTLDKDGDGAVSAAEVAPKAGKPSKPGKQNKAAKKPGKVKNKDKKKPGQTP